MPALAARTERLGTGDQDNPPHKSIQNNNLEHISFPVYAQKQDLETSAQTALRLKVEAENAYQIADAGAITPEPGKTGAAPAKRPRPGVEGQTPDNLEEVRVTGARVSRSATVTRIDAPLLETPATVNVLTDDFLDSIVARRPEDAFVFTPGISQGGAQENAGSTVNFNVRGFNNNRDYFVNGLRGNRLFGIGAPDLATVERIEILKGTSSLLFGTARPGGLLNIVTKRPRAEARHSIEGRTGAFDALDLARIELDSTGPITGNGNLLYRVIVAANHERSTRRGDNSDSSAYIDRVVIAPGLSWLTPTDGRLDIGFEYSFVDQPLDNGIFFVNDQFLFNGPTTVGPGSKNVSNNYKAEVRYIQALSKDWELRISANYHRSKRDQFFNVLPLSFPGNPNLARALISSVMVDYQQAQPRIELAGDWQPFEWMEHKLLVGADYYQTKVDEAGAAVFTNPIDPLNFQIGFPAIKPTRIPRGSSKTDEYGIYFQDYIRLFDKFTILGGVRVLDYDQTKAGNTFVRGDAVDFTVGGSYSVTGNITAFMSFSTSTEIQFGQLRGGGFVPPRESEQIEAGIKTEWFDGRFGANLSVFEIEQTNQAESDLTDSTRTFSVLVGTQRSRGVELEVIGSPWHGLNLSGSFSFIDAEITESATPANIGNHPVSVPEMQASLFAQYNFTGEFGGSLGGFYLGSGLVYVDDERPGNTANTFTLPGYTRWDLVGGYRKNGWDIRLNIENVTNKNYVAGSRDFARIVQGPKRFFTLNLGYEF